MVRHALVQHVGLAVVALQANIGDRAPWVTHAILVHGRSTMANQHSTQGHSVVRPGITCTPGLLCSDLLAEPLLLIGKSCKAKLPQLANWASGAQYNRWPARRRSMNRKRANPGEMKGDYFEL